MLSNQENISNFIAKDKKKVAVLKEKAGDKETAPEEKENLYKKRIIMVLNLLMNL